ncbi:MAG: hypothetical protein ABIQ40_04715 [Bacteroidia bacterium]
MKSKNKHWILGKKFRNSEGELEVEVITKKGQSRICRITVSDFKNVKEALEIGKRIMKRGK